MWCRCRRGQEFSRPGRTSHQLVCGKEARGWRKRIECCQRIWCVWLYSCPFQWGSWTVPAGVNCRCSSAAWVAAWGSPSSTRARWSPWSPRSSSSTCPHRIVTISFPDSAIINHPHPTMLMLCFLTQEAPVNLILIFQSMLMVEFNFDFAQTRLTRQEDY